MSVELFVEPEMPIDFAYLELLREERELVSVACPQEDVARLWATAVKLLNKYTSRVENNEKELTLLRKIRAVLRRLQMCGIDVAEELADVKTAIRLCKSALKERKRLLKALMKRGRTEVFATAVVSVATRRKAF
jgi:hypothetical protein